jgi:D-serine deaminase-like pyridoxal phosphate-dependent protein
MHVDELQTPALVVERTALEANLATMATALPGARLRPHVKAHKCTALAGRQFAHGHHGFTCATIREAEGLVAAGLGQDLLLANEVVDARRLGRLVDQGARVTLAVDSDTTVAAASHAGVREVIIDVNVGLPRCGCPPEEAGQLADLARRRGLEVRGVMGYEGHTMGVADRRERHAQMAASMARLAEAHAAVGGAVCSAGGTGTYDLHATDPLRVATEVQAGSYALMDHDYAKLGLPFAQALRVLATVISVNHQGGWAVADCGLKALGMDHGLPVLADGSTVWFCSDEHLTFSPMEGAALPAVGTRVQVIPSHVDPTVAYHEAMYLVEGNDVVDRWAVDLRGW